jgi:hypothetical protein
LVSLGRATGLSSVAGIVFLSMEMLDAGGKILTRLVVGPITGVGGLF